MELRLEQETENVATTQQISNLKDQTCGQQDEDTEETKRIRQQKDEPEMTR